MTNLFSACVKFYNFGPKAPISANNFGGASTISGNTGGTSGNGILVDAGLMRCKGEFLPESIKLKFGSIDQPVISEWMWINARRCTGYQIGG